MYTLKRICRVCGHEFRRTLQDGETWPNTCEGCDHTVAAGPNVNKLGLQPGRCEGSDIEALEGTLSRAQLLASQAGPDILNPPLGDGTGRKRGW